MKDKTPNENQTVIGPSVSVEGNFTGDGNIIVEGKLKGSINTNHDLTIGKDAIIEANIFAENAIIYGKVDGDLKIKNSLELAKNAKINGNISCKSLNVEAGSVFNGQCTMKQHDTEETKTNQ